MVAAFKHGDPLAGVLFFDFGAKHLHAAQIGGEDHHALLGILPPEDTESGEQLFDLGFALRGEFGE